jgi:hypothetical protein
MRNMRSFLRVLPLFVLLLAGTVVPVRAQTQAYDIATFSPPPGWKAERRQTSMEFTSIDQAAQTYCILGVYASTPGSVSADAAFAREWDALAGRGFSGGAPPKPSGGRTPSGLGYLEGGSTVSQGGKTSYARLTVFAAGNRTMSIVLLASNQAALGARRVTLQSFFESLRFNLDQSRGGMPPDVNAGPTPSSSQAPVSRLTYQVPAGWSRAESGGAVTLARTVDLGFGQQQRFRITIGAQVSLAGNPLDTFHALWRTTIGSMFDTQFHPLPLRVRLQGGARG